METLKRIGDLGPVAVATVVAADAAGPVVLGEANAQINGQIVDDRIFAVDEDRRLVGGLMVCRGGWSRAIALLPKTIGRRPPGTTLALTSGEGDGSIRVLPVVLIAPAVFGQKVGPGLLRMSPGN